MLILADTREKQLLKRLALISFRSDIIDFNEMFIEWSAGVAKSFARLPDGYLWGSHRGEAERHTNPLLPELLQQASAHLHSLPHTAEYIWLLILIKSAFTSWNTFLTLTPYRLKCFNWNTIMLIWPFKISPKIGIITKLKPRQPSLSYVSENTSSLLPTQQILLTFPVRDISAVIDWQGVTLLLWGPRGPVWFIEERMDVSVNITKLQLLPSALRGKNGCHEADCHTKLLHPNT